MKGAVCGDIVGSVYEFDNFRYKEFPLFAEDAEFTDDSVLTVATMDALLHGIGYAEAYKKWFLRYPGAGYGGRFLLWGLGETLTPYNSFGNGSAMRVSPIGLWHATLEETIATARASAEATHNHPEGIKGAEATAAAIYLARTGADKLEVKEYISQRFGYDLSESLESIRSWYEFDESCQGTVPQAIICFLGSNSFEDAIRNAISIGGDSDTIACIAGGIAEAFYGIPQEIEEETMRRLPEEMREIVDAFYDAIAKRKMAL
jgi:ADP-ribosylglycohydrolase